MKCKNGQSTVEYAVVIAVIIAALIAMQVYVKRGAMGKLRASADQIGEQFEPKQANFVYNTTYTGNTQENLATTGVETTKITTQNQIRTGNEAASSTMGNNIF